MTASVKILPRLLRRLHEYLGRQADAEAAGLREDLTRAGTVRARRLERSRPRREAAEKRRAERLGSAEQIRIAVFARANGRCECCRSRTPCEWHHLISGGLRRAMESVETTAAVCAWCHTDLHRNKEHSLMSMRRWALDHGYEAARKAIEHRAEKLGEARSSARREET